MSGRLRVSDATLEQVQALLGSVATSQCVAPVEIDFGSPAVAQAAEQVELLVTAGGRGMDRVLDDARSSARVAVAAWDSADTALAGRLP